MECDFKAQAYVLLIHLYSHKEAFEKALHYGDAAFQLNNRLNDMLIASRIHHALCVAYLNSGARGELTEKHACVCARLDTTAKMHMRF